MPVGLEGLDSLPDSMQNIAAANKKRKRQSASPAHGNQQGQRNSFSTSGLNSNGDSTQAHLSQSMIDSLKDVLHGSSGMNGGDYSNGVSQHLRQPEQNDNASSTAAAALAAHHGQLTSSQGGDLSFMSTGSGADGDRGDSAFDIGVDGNTQSSHGPGPYHIRAYSGAPQSQPTTQSQVQAARESSAGGMNVKPAVGSDEWHKVRKDNHKEVERRRRETINEGINELAKLVPNCDKNKGSVLQAAVSYIQQLKQAQETIVTNRTMEKVVMEQAVSELTATNQEYKAEIKRAWAMNAYLKRKLNAAGVEYDEDEGRKEVGPRGSAGSGADGSEER
ncbi:basic helix-loop-helix protein [Agyrium rufum]|nr:basic helix-loop-helix protein [Agyrium rufum]